MEYPSFFNTVPTIKVQDPLSNILGAFENGIYEFNFLEIVKSARHSCPTVAGAYLITLQALKALYGDEMIVRGNISVEFKEDLEDGVAGVISNVVSQITGATNKSGFKGLGGKFARHSLMNFNSNISSSARFTRVDTQKSVDVFYNPNSVAPDTKQMPLMQKILTNEATKNEVIQFGVLWQDRVKRIFDNLGKVVRTEVI